MKLGTFSVSLNVKDIKRSKQFYTTLGFEIVGGEENENWLILRNGDTTIGLFQGMFPSNILTFNPGWDSTCNALESFDDIRELHKNFRENGIKFINESLTSNSGPANFSIEDPDGNMILFDQHV